MAGYAVNLSEDVRTVIPKPIPATSAAPRNALQQRAERILVRAVPQIHYQLARLGPVGVAGIAVLAVACVAAISLLLPAHQSLLTLRSELMRPGRGAPATARPERTPQQFAAALPSRDEIPALLGVVLVQAAESGIVLEQGKYTFSPAAPNRLARYTFEFPVKADYGNIRNFVNKSLASIPALGLDKLHLERKNVGDTLVSAEVGFIVYLRGA
jgi:hypothetical protein